MEKRKILGHSGNSNWLIIFVLYTRWGVEEIRQFWLDRRERFTSGNWHPKEPSISMDWPFLSIGINMQLSTIFLCLFYIEFERILISSWLFYPKVFLKFRSDPLANILYFIQLLFFMFLAGAFASPLRSLQRFLSLKISTRSAQKTLEFVLVETYGDFSKSRKTLPKECEIFKQKYASSFALHLNIWPILQESWTVSSGEFDVKFC